MKRVTILSGLLLAFAMVYAQHPQIKWTTGDWNADSLGNHRVLVQVDEEGEAVFCHIPWRRKDFHPDEKEILVFSARTGEAVNNVFRVDINREFGQLIFEPASGAGQYYLYTMPYETSGSKYYPTVHYLQPQDRADPVWKNKYHASKMLSPARVLEIQSINEFHSFWPMEVIATQKEMDKLLAETKDKEYLLFPEDRLHPIKMWTDLPERWINRPLTNEFRLQGRKNESLAFQVGVYASQSNLNNLNVLFSDLTTAYGQSISGDAFTCYNTSGTDWVGNHLVKEVNVEKGQVQALWMGLMIPENATPGLYKTTIQIHPEGLEAQSLVLFVDVSEEVVADHGDSQPELHSRLRWLNSVIADDHDLIHPYTPIVRSGDELRLLGRTVRIAETGLPQQITGFFNRAMTDPDSDPTDLLHDQMSFRITYADGRIEQPSAGKVVFEDNKGGAISWTSQSTAGKMKLTIRGSLEADGFLGYEIDLKCSEDVEIQDIALLIPMNSEVAEYMLGLGNKGGFAPDQFSWRWDPFFNNDGPWIGTVQLGLQSSFRDQNYERPLNTNFYHQKPLKMPPSWYNDGQGGIELKRTGTQYELMAYSGKRTLKANDVLHFNAQFLITPFHALDTRSQWNTRYYHRYEPVDSVLGYGGNTINVHHATEINPFINYPFMTPEIMKEYIDEAHSKNARVKIYYTVRELSNICPEIWALKSLGDEILSYGAGGGYSWLQEHLDGNYIAAWFVPELKDAAVINSGVSRWHNYYLEGLNWLVSNVGIDGIYIDDVAFDRSIMKRVRKILKRGNPNAIIDLHSANQFNTRDGFANSANLYMEHFAYIDRLWFGEYFDYDAGPEYWLTEVSGIPFGIMGEMLENGGNQWRGMIYGMTSRAPWSGDPSPVWKVWDDFGIEDSEMIGYWVDDCPVQTGRPDILATVYKKEGKSLIALASWASGPARIQLTIDWDALGIDPDKALLHMPAVRDFQDEAYLNPGETFQVPEKKGFLMYIMEKE